jgi:hypothetical protein
MFVGVLGWILFGLIAGYVASTLANSRRDGLQYLEPSGRRARSSSSSGSLARHPTLGLASIDFTMLR